jgi:predicted metal-dependent hydrolase
MVTFRNWFRRRFSAKYRLAYTAAAEHYTAALAYLIVRVKPEMISRSAVPFRGVILYHSMEELEHKGVCYDLFNHYSGSYLTRIAAFIHLSLDLVVKIFMRYKFLLSQDGIWDRTHRKKTMEFLIGTGGIMRLMAGRILSYFKPRFHPWMYDDRQGVRDKFTGVMREAGIEDFLTAGPRIAAERERFA